MTPQMKKITFSHKIGKSSPSYLFLSGDLKNTQSAKINGVVFDPKTQYLEVKGKDVLKIIDK